MRSYKPMLWIGLALLFAVVVYGSLFFGSVVYQPDKPFIWSMIFWSLRFPRLMLAIVTGAALALGGVVYQALLKNPLAEPYLLGVSSGAALGAVVGVVIGQTLHIMSLQPVFAFAGALFAFLLIITIAKLSGKISTFSLILSGVVLNSFFSALITLLLSLFPRKTFGVLFWLMGNLEMSDPTMILVFAVLVVVALVIVWRAHRVLDALSLGDEEAYHLGIDVSRQKIFLLIISSVTVASAVMLTGVIGFIGLIVPHFARALVGARHLRVIPAAVFLGGLFVAVGNVLIYGILKNPDLPIGVFTALLGIPFLFYIFLNEAKSQNR